MDIFLSFSPFLLFALFTKLYLFDTTMIYSVNFRYVEIMMKFVYFDV